MKNIFGLASLISLFPSFMHAQHHGDETSILYAITGNGLTDTSYVFGTFHLIEREHFYIAPEVDKAFSNAEQLAFEIKLDDPGMLQTMQSWTTLPQGMTWNDFASAEEIAYLNNYFRDSMHADFTPYLSQKPFVAYQSMTASMMGENPASYELYFMMGNMSQPRPIFGLETLTSQLKIFDSIPYETQVGWITTDSDQSMTSQSALDNMVKQYQSGDINAIYTSTVTNTPEFQAYEDLFITNRNKNWIPIIGNLASKGSTFVAVGAAHLGGPNGVVKLLQQAGYTLTPISLTEK